MLFNMRLLLHIFVICAVILQAIANPKSQRNKLIYILLDGFRYDYAVSQPPEQLPGFTKFISEGVRAEWMTGVYPTLSYPSWTTLVTGQYPETHGIVGNYFYDAEDKDYFSLYDVASTGKRKWWKTEPIWHTATKNDIRTAVYLFGRCDIEFNGVVPEICEHFVKITGKEIFRTNVDKALERLDEGFEFIGIYTEHTDTTAHARGPDSEELKQAVRDHDATLWYLQERLEQKNLTDQVNIVIVSDHGMQDTTVKTTNKIDMDIFLDPNLVENIADKGAFINIKVNDGNVGQVHESLNQMPGVTAYLKDMIPNDLNYKNNKYIHDIIVKASIGTWVRASRDKRQLPPRNDDFVYYGGHGYDPREETMRATFLAKGPDFKENVKIPSIDMVDVYPLLASLLDIVPGPNNGTLGHLGPALNYNVSNAGTPVVSIVLVALSTIIAFANI